LPHLDFGMNQAVPAFTENLRRSTKNLLLFGENHILYKNSNSQLEVKYEKEDSPFRKSKES
jgi:hypothetical protein